MRTVLTETFLTNGAFVASLRFPALVDDEVPGAAKGKACPTGTPLAAALDAYEAEVLKKGGKVVANADHPTRPNWKVLAEKFGVHPSHLSAKHLGYRQRVVELGKLYGLEPPPVAPTPLPFADFSVIAIAHRERELEQEGDAARDQQLAAFKDVMVAITSTCDPAQDARDVLVSAVISVGVESLNKPFGFLDEVKRALAYVGRWDANEDLPRNPTHLLRYAIARSA